MSTFNVSPTRSQFRLTPSVLAFIRPASKQLRRMDPKRMSETVGPPQAQKSRLNKTSSKFFRFLGANWLAITTKGKKMKRNTRLLKSIKTGQATEALQINHFQRIKSAQKGLRGRLPGRFLSPPEPWRFAPRSLLNLSLNLSFLALPPSRSRLSFGPLLLAMVRSTFLPA